MRTAARDVRRPACRPLRSVLPTGLLLATTLSSFGPCALADPTPSLPDGPGRDLIARKCTQCHSLENVTRTRHTRKQWEAQLDTMIARGARLSDEDFERIADYLAAELGLPAKD